MENSIENMHTDVRVLKVMTMWPYRLYVIMDDQFCLLSKMLKL